MRIRRSRRPRRSGAVAAEAALIVSFLLYFVSIATDYPRLFHMLATLTDTARAGAVYASSHPKATAGDIQQVALADATNMKPSPKIVTMDAEDASENEYVKVTASTTFSTLLPNPGIPSSINLSRSVTMMRNP